MRRLPALLFGVPLATLALAPPAHANDKVPAPSIPASAIPTVKCLYSLFKSSPAVQAVDIYVVDEWRLAIEFRFTGKDRKAIISDLMLFSAESDKGYDITYDIQIPRSEPDAAGWDSADFVYSLNLGSKCGVSPVFDSTVPGPKARDEWQRVDPSTLLPLGTPSPH